VAGWPGEDGFIDGFRQASLTNLAFWVLWFSKIILDRIHALREDINREFEELKSVVDHALKTF
jgi:hypothetical protein